jgi:hypothetical protein
MSWRDRLEQTPAQIMHAAFLTLGMGLLIGELTLFAVGTETPWRWLGVALTPIFFIGGVACSVLDVAHRDVTQGPREQDEIVGLGLFEDLSPEQVWAFVNAVLFPNSICSRLQDSYTVSTRALSLRSVYTLRLLSGGTHALSLIPLIPLRKGELLDDFEAVSESGLPCASLSYSDYLALASAIIRTLFSLDGAATFQNYLDDHEAAVVNLIAMHATESPAAVGQRQEALRALDEFVGKSPYGRIALALVSRLALNYMVVVQLPNEVSSLPFTWCKVHVSQRKLLPLRSPKISFPWIHNWIIDKTRKLLGVRTSSFEVPLGRAKLARSYHAEFMGPPGTYLARQDCDAISSSSTAYIRLRRRLGQRYAHLYVRNGDDPLETSRLKMWFYERPPGSIGAATVAAAANLVILAMAATLDVNSPKSQRADVVAVLLAFPGIAATWISLDRPGSLIGGTLAAKFSSLLTLALALAGASVFYHTVHEFSIFSKWQLGEAHGDWAVILVLGIANVLGMIYAWVRRSIMHGVILGRSANETPDDRVDTRRGRGILGWLIARGRQG